MTKKTILLVEDDQFLSELYSDILTSEGYDVTTKCDGDEAFKTMSSAHFDLILLDINLPGRSGIEIMEQYTNTNKNVTNQSVVFLTNMEDESVVQAARRFSCAYIIKSTLSPAQFIEAVGRHLKDNQV